ncbi:ABC transporter ATP-binding protein [soil metagenome]
MKGLELENVDLTYNRGRVDEVRALRGLSLEVEQGEFLTIVGSNGAGKSSTVQIVSGSARPTCGRVMIDGKDVSRKPDYRRAGLVARVFDDPRMGSAPELSIEDNLALAFSRGSRRRLRWASGPKRRAVMREGLAALGLGLEHRLHDPVGLLSAGQRQSLTMVMAGLTAPRILLLDEHLAALDPSTARRVLDLTVGLASDLGCTTLMVTHNMDHALELGNRMLVMGGGRIIADIDQQAKSRLDVAGVIALIVSSGGVVSDRSLLPQTEMSA